MSDSDDGSSDDDRVGYKRPPKKHQFKKGQSGNPSGRSKKTQPWLETARRVFGEKMTVMVNGRPTAIDANMYFARLLVDSALRGNVSAIRKVMQADLAGGQLVAMVEQSRRSGVLVVPEVCADADEWEARYGAEAQARAAAAKSTGQ